MLRGRQKFCDGVGGETLNNILPCILLAVLLGYSLQMISRGAEQIFATLKHETNKQAIRLESSQVELLLDRANPQDQVLYNSVIVMPYYFIHGAMKLGAVYYHSEMLQAKKTVAMLESPRLRFAALYNPTVYHPSYEGVMENKWWTTSPNFHYSPLDSPRKNYPLSREGILHASDFNWLEIRVRDGVDYPSLKVLIHNPGGAAQLTISGDYDIKRFQSEEAARVEIPPNWSGWLELTPRKPSTEGRFRIGLPSGEPKFLIAGIKFGEEKLHWPWKQRAEITFMPKTGSNNPISISFDPRKLLPPPLNQKNIKVLNDDGSSVLVEILGDN